MDNGVNYRDLAKRYGLAPVPESVLRLTQLVAQQDADIDQMAKVIDKEPALRARLLRVANFDAQDESEYIVETAEDALMRHGVGCALLLAMGTPLSLALVKTFQTMLSLKLDSVDPRTMMRLEGVHLLGTIGFTGKANGRVYLRMSLESAKEIAARIIGVSPAEMTDVDEINDTTGEVLNIMTGNFKSNLCDAGLDCKLETPEVSRTEEHLTPIIPGGCVEHMAFRSGLLHLFVNVTVNPWNG
jgi:CheY-specific phosphatase CheX